ncbi:MAG: VCBS repeat-containing protein [Candidatus Sumerlaeota bacterium]
MKNKYGKLCTTKSHFRMHRGNQAHCVLMLMASAITFGVSARVDGQVINLSEVGTTQPGFVIDAVEAGDNSGFNVSGAGDVNGDGLADLIVSDQGAVLDDARAGEIHIIFGKKDNGTVDLANPGDSGFRINAYDVGNATHAVVSAAGDVNGDGLDDIIVGMPKASSATKVACGQSFVIFGKKDSQNVSTGTLGSGGFRIEGAAAQNHLGGSVSAAGDVNGDGLSDLIVGAYNANPGSSAGAGISYVLFGKTNGDVIDTANLGSAGFTILGINASDHAGICVSGAGDINGDGLADLVVGADGVDRTGMNNVGAAYVVFGKQDTSAVSLAALGSQGFGILGIAAYDHLGYGVAGAGDVNGDGLGDVIVSAHIANAGGLLDAGEGYVVFGKATNTTVSLSALGTGGFRIAGDDSGDHAGVSVSGLGDFNADGLADIILGADEAAPNGHAAAGESYVVFGKATNTIVSLASLGAGGIRADGFSNGGLSGHSVSGTGDVNGDGLPDLMIGAYKADTSGRNDPGQSYIVFNSLTAPESSTYRAMSKTGNAPRIAVGISGDGSNDSFPDSRCWIDFADGSGPGLNGASLQTVTLTRGSDGIGNLPGVIANAAWQISTDRTGWTSATVSFHYTDSQIGTSMESSLSVYAATSLEGPWTKLPSIGNGQKNIVSASVTSFSYFALTADESGTVGWRMK